MIQQDKIKDWVEMYLDHIEELSIQTHVSKEEGYKFIAVDHFLRNFNINSTNLSENIDIAILNNNLVAGNMYWPKVMLVQFAQEYEDETRNTLTHLYDHTVDVNTRIDDTESSFEQLLNKWKNERENEENSKSFISLRFISLLLGFQYPNDYNAVKPREWNMFCKYINDEFAIPAKTPSGQKYLILNEHIDALIHYIKTIPEITKIKEQLTRGLSFTDDEYRWVAQDIIYITARLIAEKQEVVSTSEKITEEGLSTDVSEDIEITANERLEFPLEAYLENFIIRNWQSIDFGEDLELFIDDEGVPAQQYPTSEGFIDILAKDSDNNFVVIELKRGKSNQKVVGQILSYIGWVQKNLADGKKVRGIIIVADGNNALQDAISVVSDTISLKYYRVTFSFEDPQP